MLQTLLFATCLGCGSASAPSENVTPVKEVSLATKTGEADAAAPKSEKKITVAKSLSEAPANGDNPNRINQLRSLETVQLSAAGQKIQAWVMNNESKRQEGMMFLTNKDVKENQGMIFVFTETQTAKDHSFWMHNCPLGLDIIYISKAKRVINVGDGRPENDDQVPAKADYSYVLEMKRGWAKRHRLSPGDAIEMPVLATTE